MSESLSRWLRDWLSVPVPSSVLGEKESLVEVFADVKLVGVLTLEKLRTIADGVGMPAYEALAVWPYAQPVTVAHPEVYAGLNAETVFWLPPPGKKMRCHREGEAGRRSCREAPSDSAAQEGKAAQRAVGMDQGRRERAARPAGTALKQRLVRESEPPCFSVRRARRSRLA